MNENKIITDTWSNEASKQLYLTEWEGDPDQEKVQTGLEQCGGCSFFAPFNDDYGLCCNGASRHHLETVFEHFTCVAVSSEGWGPHSVTKNEEHHCRCKGDSSEEWERLISEFERVAS